MLHALRLRRRTEQVSGPPTADLLISTLRNLIMMTLAICGGVYLLSVTTALLTHAVRQLFFLTLLAAVISFLSWHLLTKQMALALGGWLAGMSAIIVLAAYQFQRTDLLNLLVFVPFTATMILGWLGGVATEVGLALVLWALDRAGLAPALDASDAVVILAGGGFSVCLGWASMQAFLSVAQWSIANYEQALERMTELRDQRVELKQVQEDLLQANNEMARMADRLRALHQAAEDARRTKEEFVANISHELRTPLNMIIGFSEMITQSPRIYSTDLPTTLLADITAIQRNSQHLARLVDDVLDLSQVEAGRMAVTKEWVPLRDIAEAAALAVRPLYQSKALALKVDMPDLPMVFCDGTRIRQVILNLLSNAGRFTERGGVTVSARHEGDNIVVSVSDTGPGIKPEDQKRLFEPFQQLDSSLRRKHGGSGLGLTISRRFVEMHNGRMWLDSTVGVGTTISFSLPVSQAPKATLAGEDWRRWFNPYRAYDERTRRSKATAPAPAPRYVVVEPHNTLHRLFARYASDIEIMPVATIAEAVSELDRTPATVVVVNAPLHTDTLSVRAGQ